ncbi:MAG: methyltransferase domain-containing protein [Planctomycetia bacterium]|nr:methyltransferase domain-containing protein [Planctomycetia bacterium]
MKSDALHASVVERFTKIATSPGAEQKFPVGPKSAKRLGYDAAEIDALPPSVTESFCGVGNPFSLGEPRPGQTVLDLGCGAGFDTIHAARRVGSAGRCIGIDMTAAMIEKARKNAALAGVGNVEFRQAEIERLPVDDGSIDLVISNGVFNLSTDKPRVLSEVFRVLRPGGRLQMADILLEPQVTPEEAAQKGAWSD